MSDMYAIKDTTLTAIGDAVRSKTSKYISVDECPENPIFEIELDTSTFETYSYSDTYGYNFFYETQIDFKELLGDVYGSTQRLYCSYEYEANSINKYVVSIKSRNSFEDKNDKSNILITDYQDLTGNGSLFIDLPTNNYNTITASRTKFTSTENDEIKVKVKFWACNSNNEFLVLNKYTPLEMADTINEISAIPVEAFNISGICLYRFAYSGWDWLLSQYGDKLTFNDISNASYMFAYSKAELGDFELNIDDKADCSYMCYYSQTKKAPKINGNIGKISYMFGECRELVEIPYDIYCDNSTYYEMGSVFSSCYKLETLPYIYNAYPNTIDDLFYNCHMLREIPEDYMDTWNFSRIYSYSYAYIDGIFRHCYSLRKVPFKILQKLRNETATSQSTKFYNRTFEMCYALDELVDLPVDKAKLTSNAFSGFVERTYRLSNLMFETNEDGTPIVAPWKSQTIDLTSYVGYGMFWGTPAEHDIIKYNSGITTDKEVKDDATYQALKNDPDWWSMDINYSRYNHDSAVNTINSLPDCSATGTNTIKFKGTAGSLTDGGAINTLTEEEIAVATAKGWTVSLV